MVRSNFRLSCKTLLLTYKGFVDENELKELVKRRKDYDEWNFAYHYPHEGENYIHTHVFITFKSRVDWSNRNCLDIKDKTPEIRSITKIGDRTEVLGHIGKYKLSSDYKESELEKEVSFMETRFRDLYSSIKFDEIKSKLYFDLFWKRTYHKNKSIDKNKVLMKEKVDPENMSYMVWLHGKNSSLGNLVFDFLLNTGLSFSEIRAYSFTFNGKDNENKPIVTIDTDSLHIGFDKIEEICQNKIAFVLSTFDPIDTYFEKSDFLTKSNPWIVDVTNSTSRIFTSLNRKIKNSL